MRITSYILIAFGIYLLACATYDEYEGTTVKPVELSRSRRHEGYLYRLPVVKKVMPDVFRRFMRLHWIYASAVVVFGVILLLIDTRPNGP